MDLDFQGCFGMKKKLCLITEEIRYCKTDNTSYLSLSATSRQDNKLGPEYSTKVNELTSKGSHSNMEPCWITQESF